jgi:hypothetical protein
MSKICENRIIRDMTPEEQTKHDTYVPEEEPLTPLKRLDALEAALLETPAPEACVT